MTASAILVLAALLALAPATLAGIVGDWVALAPMPSARQEIAVAVLDGKVYVIGGFDELGRSTATVEVYDTETDTWSSAASLPFVTNHNAAAVSGGRLYVFGGTTNRVLVYDREADAWSDVAPMHFVHGGTPAVAVIDGAIYVAGGTGSGMVGNEVEVYHPETRRWTLLAPMRVLRNHTAGGAIDGRFYVAGGRGTPESSTALEVYDPAANRWSTLAPMPTGRSGIAAGVVEGRLYVFGGEIPGIFGQVEAYDPATNTWASLPPMPTPRHGIWAGVLGGSIYLPGGATRPGLGATSANEVIRIADVSIPVVTGASVRRKKLTVTGQNFDAGATILVDGVEKATRNRASDPERVLISRRGGKGIRHGETVTLRVRNGDATLSPEFRFTRPSLIANR